MASSSTTVAGFYRVALAAEDVLIVVFVPLRKDRRIDVSARRPFLLRAQWNGLWYGELDPDRAVIEWGTGDGPGMPPSRTDLLSAPLKLGALFKVWNTDDPDSDSVPLTIKALDRL